jgi:alkaline phosphatase
VIPNSQLLLTGFVTTARVSHATPGALYAHNCDRYWECDWQVPNPDGVSPPPVAPEDTHDIAWQLVRRDPGKSTNVIFGGGLSAFIPEQDKDNYEDLVRRFLEYMGVHTCGIGTNKVT